MRASAPGASVTRTGRGRLRARSPQAMERGLGGRPPRGTGQSVGTEDEGRGEAEVAEPAGAT